MKPLARLAQWAGLLLAAAAPTSVSAETLPIDGIYGASVDLPGDIELIVAEPFGGDAGPDASLAINAELGQAVIGGEPYFRLLPASLVRGGTVTVLNSEGIPVESRETERPDAVLRGSVHSEVFERRLDPRIRSECVVRNENDDCVEREEERIPCRELTVRVEPRIILSDKVGRQLYSNNSPLEAAQRYCFDDTVQPSALDMAGGLIDQFARLVRLDLAPIRRVQGIRIMESRKDLRREDRRAFRDAVRLTKSDIDGSCSAFRALEADNPEHISVLFNIGLCFEGEGDLVNAEAYYQQALRVDPGRSNPKRGIERLNQRWRGEAQLAAREQARERAEVQRGRVLEEAADHTPAL